MAKPDKLFKKKNFIKYGGVSKKFVSYYFELVTKVYSPRILNGRSTNVVITKKNSTV